MVVRWRQTPTAPPAVAAAQDLADHHANLPGDGYTLRFPDPASNELLFVDKGPGEPAMAFRFASGPVADGTVAHNVRTNDTVDGTPVYEMTISDSIPVADRMLVARRLVAHEVAGILDSQRPRSFAERLLRRSPFDHHEAGILAELRLELADGR